jgi:hypothetical protein
MEILVQILIVAVLLLYPVWRTFDRAGLPPALALLVLVPAIGMLIALGILAFGEWPVHRYAQDTTGEEGS